jgi:hypothetical protein
VVVESEDRGPVGVSGGWGIRVDRVDRGQQLEAPRSVTAWPPPPLAAR